MCDIIILPDGTEISLLPLPFIYTKSEGGHFIEEKHPAHAQSCLCQFPKESIEFWLKGQFPDCDITYDVGFGEWLVKKKNE